MTKIELTPSIYIYQDDNYYLVNSCCIILNSELVFIDTGDNLLSKMPQFFPFDNTNLDDWISGLQEWEKMDVDWVVVGHGDVVKKDHITRVREFFEELVIFLERSASEKLSIEQVLSHENCPTYFEEDPENWTTMGIEAYYSRMIE